MTDDEIEKIVSSTLDRHHKIMGIEAKEHYSDHEFIKNWRTFWGNVTIKIGSIVVGGAIIIMLAVGYAGIKLLSNIGLFK